ncbi:helix-turn-helix domain-containing protein [Dinghuibacter silviterrae]|uniref:AraC-like DNA-binding protein n=1 Tax=Dinghuibacter silviterrae TaxID=1539049 RepID=A0A4R8DF04_9BACT|nr:AraC family transcriptional regulator [Dinghuibacter silviterrae]TDW95814.1 AraC-like DNA-binding protein [Dinghuibacter silviterrae]
MNTSRNTPAIVSSCYHAQSRAGEQFAPEHVFSLQLTGRLILNDAEREYVCEPGSFHFTRRNHLIKFNKLPPPGGEFRTLSVYLDQETLRGFSVEYGLAPAPGAPAEGAIITLAAAPLYKSYMDSLPPYLDMDGPLLDLKVKEAILVLIRTDPWLQDILFDFSEPGKIDLEAFMQKNFHFNVELKRFAYLTGRSLATFKRDFEKIFHATPSRWLQQRRLQEAHYLIKEKGKAPSDVYLDVGFEDLSHFSFTFKKRYGVAPSRI